MSKPKRRRRGRPSGPRERTPPVAPPVSATPDPTPVTKAGSTVPNEPGGSAPTTKTWLPAGRRAEFAQQGRLWLLALISATTGAITVWRSGSVYTGTAAFVAVLVVLGPVLYIYEKKRAKR